MKVSVVVTTYNHENYITQCLDSVLCQTGDYVLEIIVGDDCSTDNTRNTLQAFQEKYPEIIKVLPPEQNLGITRNLKRCLDVCSGDYIAICEGDDYWTDVHKLQKQMDYLEIHSNCSMCFSAVMLYYEDTDTLVPHSDQASLGTVYVSVDALIERNYIGTFSCCMYRAEVVRSLPKGIFDLYTVDWFFNISCGQFGKIGFLRDPMSVYRLHAKGNWTGMGQIEKLKELQRNIDIYNGFLNYKHNASFSKLKKGVEEEIARLQNAQISETTNQSVVSTKKSTMKYLTKDIFASIFRKPSKP